MAQGYRNRSTSISATDTYGEKTIGSLLNIDLNSTADQAITISGTTKYIIRRIVVTNASVDMTGSAAAGGIYTGASKSGTTIVAASQGYTSLTAASKFIDLTLSVTADSLTATTIYLSLTTAHGSAATADIYIYGDVLT